MDLKIVRLFSTLSTTSIDDRVTAFTASLPNFNSEGVEKEELEVKKKEFEDSKANQIKAFRANLDNRPQMVLNAEKFLQSLKLEGVLSEYELINNKVSRLSRTKRDLIQMFVEKNNLLTTKK